MIPVYLFIASTVFLIGFGLLQLLLGNLSYHATVLLEDLSQALA